MEKNECTRIISGYSVIALQKLGHSEKNIRDFLTELYELIKIKTDDDAVKAIDTIEKISDNNTIQVIFEDIIIPVKYNMVSINDLFEKYNFMGKEYHYIGKRACNALRKEGIIYIKDLYGKSKKDIMYLHSIGEISYNFFVNALYNIFLLKII